MFVAAAEAAFGPVVGLQTDQYTADLGAPTGPGCGIVRTRHNLCVGQSLTEPSHLMSLPLPARLSAVGRDM